MSFLDLTLDGPPVVLVAIWSQKKTPALFSGAGCRPKLVDAIERAFSEAEFMAMTNYQGRLRGTMNMRDVWYPDDHGRFYINPKNLVYVKWLLEGAKESDVATKDFNGDIYRFDPVVVDITPKKPDCRLTVVRVLSEKLMPMNFGYGSEHYGHPRMEVLGLHWNAEYPSPPHFFA